MKVKVGTTVGFTASGSFDPNITVPEDWELDEEASSSSASYRWNIAGAGDNFSVSKQFTSAGAGQSVSVTYSGSVKNKYKVSRTCKECGRVKKGTKTVRTTKSATDSLKVNVYTVRLKFMPRSGGSGANIAAGGINNDVHIADVSVKLYPYADPEEAFGFTIEIGGSWAQRIGQAGNQVSMPLFSDSPCIHHTHPYVEWDDNEKKLVARVTATGTGWRCSHDVPPESKDPPHHYYTLRSSNLKDSSAIFSGGEPNVTVDGTVEFKWAESPEWEFEDTFTPDKYEPVTLSGLEADGVSLDGHTVWVYPMKVELAHFEWVTGSSSPTWTDETVDRTSTNDLSDYISVASAEDGTGDGHVEVKDGQVTVYQRVPMSAPSGTPPPDRIRMGTLVKKVHFKAADMNVCK